MGSPSWSADGSAGGGWIPLVAAGRNDSFQPMTRTAWITGGATGIGAGVAHALAADGWRVWLTSRSAEACAATASAIGPLATAAAGDVTDPAAMTAIVQRIQVEAGGLDCLVCSAGLGVYGALDGSAPAVLEHVAGERGRYAQCRPGGVVAG